MNEYYKNIEVKLESIADKLLKSNVNNDNDILLNVQNIIEKIFIESALRISRNNISNASKLLGINRNTMSKKIKEFQDKNIKKKKR